MRKDIKTKENVIELITEIEESIQKDVGSAVGLYIKHFIDTKEGIGFFAIPRLIFPEIDAFGGYFSGTIKNTPEYAIMFMKEYFVRINTEYKRKSAFVYVIYRHGLMHQHTPKFMSYRKKNVGWAIQLTEPGKLNHHLKMRGKTVYINGVQFYEDLMKSIRLYKKDIEKDKNNLVKRFIKAHKETMEAKPKTILLKEKPYLKQSDFDFLK